MITSGGVVAGTRSDGRAQAQSTAHQVASHTAANRTMSVCHLIQGTRRARAVQCLKSTCERHMPSMRCAPMICDGNRVVLRIGSIPIELPEPVAALARTLLADPRYRLNTAAHPHSPWLFPGTIPGRRPVGPVALSDRPTRSPTPDGPEATQQAVKCPVCYGSAKVLVRAQPPCFGACRGRSSR